MKILYIGHYKEGSGWSNAAINNILALDSIGIDVVCRDIKLTNSENEVPERIKELEQKNLRDIDFCIQHVLPHHLCSTGKFRKNIAYFVHESNTLKHNNWFINLKNMDEVWVPSNYSKNNLLNDGIKNVKVIHHTFEIFQYQTEYPKINFKELNDYFKFYTITDINDRKNIDSIIKCFFSEFNSSEPVCLVLKIKKYGFSSEKLSSYMRTKIDSIKKQLRMYKNDSSYPRQILITSEMNSEQIHSLHQSCDCFIGISHGEGWSIPAFEAMCFGKTPICSNEGGPQEFINQEDLSTGCLIDGVYSVCNHSDPAFQNIFTGNEEWFEPSESQTKKMMRYYYENKHDIDKIAGIKQARKFSYENVANKMKEFLDD